MVKLFEEEIHIMQLFYSMPTHDRPIPSIGTIFNIISKSLVFGIVGCIATHNAFDLCFLIGNKYSEIFLINNCQCQNEVKNHTVPP
jgi:hypothetical protein